MNPWLAMLCLALVVAAAVAVVTVVRRRRTAIEIGPATGFVAGAYALVVGLLLVAVITHFDEARYAVLDETTLSAAVFENAEAFPRADRIAVQHEMVCLLRSTVQQEWPRMAHDHLEGDPRTWQHQWRLNAALAAAEPTAGELAAYDAAATSLEDRNEARIKRLYEGQTLMTPAHWIVLLIGAFLVIVLIGFELKISSRPAWFAVFGMMILSIAILLAAIAFIDTPYSGFWQVTALPIETALDVMRGMPGSDEAFRPCAPITVPQ